MRDYLTRFIDIDGFSVLITLLNYDNRISDELMTIRIPTHASKLILVDTALVSGMGEYRFIKSTLKNNGMFNLDEYEYVQCSSVVKSIADEVLMNQPEYVNSSVLTLSQKSKLTRKLMYC